MLLDLAWPVYLLASNNSLSPNLAIKTEQKLCFTSFWFGNKNLVEKEKKWVTLTKSQSFYGMCNEFFTDQDAHLECQQQIYLLSAKTKVHTRNVYMNLKSETFSAAIPINIQWDHAACPHLELKRQAVSFSSVQSVPWWTVSCGRGRGGDMRDSSADILFQPFLQEALVRSSGTAS